MSIQNVLLLDGNTNILQLCQRLAEEGGFDAISIAKECDIDLREFDDYIIDGSIALIAPNQPYLETDNIDEVRAYIQEYCNKKGGTEQVNPIILKCHF